jgi:hypothetical protein
VEEQQIQLETLFRLDPSGRLRCVNEPGDPLAPRVWIGRGSERVIWRVRYDLDDRIVQAIEQVLARVAPTGDLEPEPACRAELLALLAPVADEYRGPAFILPDAPNLPHGVAEAVAIGGHNRGVLQPHLAGFDADIGRAPMAAVLVDGVAVSVCYSSRVGTQADEAGLETAPAFRGRGYALAAVSAWAAIVRAQGRLALYSTTWSNLASRSVARRLGAQLYGEDWSLS